MRHERDYEGETGHRRMHCAVDHPGICSADGTNSICQLLDIYLCRLCGCAGVQLEPRCPRAPRLVYLREGDTETRWNLDERYFTTKRTG